MFKNAVLSTSFTSEGANEYFAGRIDGGSWGRDNTFLSTLRALIDPRMKDGDTLTLTFADSSFDSSSATELAVNRAVKVITDRWGAREISNEILIHNFRNFDQEANNAWMKLMEENFEKCNEGWHRLEKVTAFFRKVFNVLCFINPGIRGVVIFVDAMDVRRLHLLQQGILAFLPWYFDPKAGVSELEMELINSLREKTSEKYEACLNKIAESYDFESARIRKMLKGFESRYERNNVDRMRESIANIMRNLEGLDRQYAEYLKQKRDNEATLMGLEMKLAQAGDDSEIMDYFLSHKMLKLENVSGTRMDFIVKTTMDFFDEDLARRTINNANSRLYKDYGERITGGQITQEEMKLLMTEIFLNQTMRIHTCAAYSLRIEGNVSTLGGYDYGPECRECLPNPHIDRYNCLGSYKTIINNRLKENDYIGAIEQCISSAKSLNFADGAVMGEFVSKIYALYGNSADTRFIEAPDGKMLTVKEAVALIKENQSQKED